jgi:hypothetical protein
MNPTAAVELPENASRSKTGLKSEYRIVHCSAAGLIMLSPDKMGPTESL